MAENLSIIQLPFPFFSTHIILDGRTIPIRHCKTEMCASWLFEEDLYVCQFRLSEKIGFARTTGAVYRVNGSYVRELNEQHPDYPKIIRDAQEKPICTAPGDVISGPWVLDTGGIITTRRLFYGHDWFADDLKVMEQRYLFHNFRKMIRGIYAEIKITTNDIAIPYLVSVLVMTKFSQGLQIPPMR